MTAVDTALEYRRLRAPREDGQMLMLPSLDRVGEWAAENQVLRLAEARAEYDVQGRSLGELGAQARSELLQQALAYTRDYRDVDEPRSADRIFLAGHQPQLFHPGVWFKNFTLSHLANRHRAVAINLLIDNDTVKGAAVKVPGGSVAAPVMRNIAFDASSSGIPYEERRIIDHDLFNSFGRRAAEHLRPLIRDPLLSEFWPRVVDRASASGNLGECLAQARHQLEGQWGASTLEIPYSRICQSESFCWFVTHLLANLPRFWDVYNESLAEYRRLHRLRGATHPMPDLSAEDGWLEAPFWLWNREDPRRRAVFVRQGGDSLWLTDRAGCEIRLPITPEADASAAVDLLADLPRQGIKLRTRALTTTLWARLALGDLFMHGIGGAKYDQLTDVLIARFFGFTPPRFLTLSATLHLPIQQPSFQEEDLRDIDRRLRGLTYHPDRCLDLPTQIDGDRLFLEAMVAEKQGWIDTAPVGDMARRRFLAIRRINHALQPWVANRREKLRRQRNELIRRQRAAAILSWREYAFCLYPAKKMKIFMLAFPSDRS